MKNNPIRVMHIVLSLGVGGAEKLVYDMISEVNAAEVYPVVCCLNMLGPLAEELKIRGYKVYHLNRSPGIDLGLITRLRKVIKKERIDVIHAHQYTPYFYGVLASLFLENIRIIMTEHGRLYPERQKWKRYLFNPLLAKKTDHIVSVSGDTRSAMVKYDNFPEHKISVIFNGVRFGTNGINVNISAKRKSLCLDDDSLVVGTAARLDEIKNFPMMLRAFKIVLARMPDTYLLIAGKGPKEQELKDLSVSLDIGERVMFIGLRYDLAEIYKLYDIFVLSSFTEGISITLLEAMAEGIPAVVTAVGGNPEVVVEGATGYMVPQGDEQAMASRIVELLQDPGKRAFLGMNGADRVQKHFSFDNMLSRYLQLYRGE